MIPFHCLHFLMRQNPNESKEIELKHNKDQYLEIFKKSSVINLFRILDVLFHPFWKESVGDFSSPDGVRPRFVLDPHVLFEIIRNLCLHFTPFRHYGLICCAFLS